MGNDVKDLKVIITDEQGVSTSYRTNNCGIISPILKYGTYTITIEDENYTLDSTEIELSEENTSFEIKVNRVEE